MADSDNPYPQQLATDAVTIELSDDKIAALKTSITGIGVSDADADAVITALQTAAKQGDLSEVVTIFTSLLSGAAGLAKTL